MDLLEIKNEIISLNKKAKELEGKKCTFPLSLYDRKYRSSVVIGEIYDVDLLEDYVDIRFNDPEDNVEISESVSIRTFVEKIYLR